MDQGLRKQRFPGLDPRWPKGTILRPPGVRPLGGKFSSDVSSDRHLEGQIWTPGGALVGAKAVKSGLRIPALEPFEVPKNALERKPPIKQSSGFS